MTYDNVTPYKYPSKQSSIFYRKKWVFENENPLAIFNTFNFEWLYLKKKN